MKGLLGFKVRGWAQRNKLPGITEKRLDLTSSIWRVVVRKVLYAILGIKCTRKSENVKVAHKSWKC